MAEIDWGRPIRKIDWRRAQRDTEEQQRLGSIVDYLVTPKWDEQQLAERSGGKVTEFLTPNYLDRRAATEAINFLRALGVIDQHKLAQVPADVEGAIATRVANERTIYQVENATQANNRQLFEPASLTNKLK